MSTTVLPPAAFGVFGNTSAQAMARLATFALDDSEGVTATPDVAGIYLGVNDPVGGIDQATTQLNIQAMILALKFGAYGDARTPGAATATGQAALPATGRPGERRVVLADTSTTGGSAAILPGQTARLGGTVPGPTVWECRRGGSGGELSWGRIASSTSQPTHCKRIFVMSANYKNYAANGSDSTAAGASGKRDTTSTPEPFYATVRAAQQAAVTAENVTVGSAPSVVYADLYTHQKTLIVGGTFPASGSPTLSWTYTAGTVPDFSGGAAYDATKDWHTAVNNQHHGTFGHHLVALTALAAIVNTSGWAAALAALEYVNVKVIGDSQTDYNSGFARASQTWAPVLGKQLQAYLDSLS